MRNTISLPIPCGAQKIPCRSGANSLLRAREFWCKTRRYPRHSGLLATVIRIISLLAGNSLNAGGLIAPSAQP